MRRTILGMRRGTRKQDQAPYGRARTATTLWIRRSGDRPCNFRPRNGASSLTIRPSCVISISLGVSERPPRSLQKALSFCARRRRSIESLGALISAQQRGRHLNLESDDESILRGRESPFLLLRHVLSLRVTLSRYLTR